MNTPPAELWPWLALAGLGLFHGINPAMGWLFAVALGLQRDSPRILLLALLPIAFGHAVAVAVTLLGILSFGFMVDHGTFMRLAAFLLIAWAVWYAAYGHRQRVRIGMQTGLVGLAVWSFLMASAHAAGLMLLPMLGPICGPSSSSALNADVALPMALAALAVHSAAMLLTIAAIAFAVYKWVGVDFLRWGWINFDRVWVVALGLSGAALLTV